MSRRGILIASVLAASLLVPEWAVAPGWADGAVRGRRTRTSPRRPVPAPEPLLSSVPGCDPALAPDRLTRPVDPEILHLLSRAAFGPSKQLVWEAHCLGRDGWIDQQLDPESIVDPELDIRLSVYPTLGMTPQELIENYRQPEPGTRPDPATTPAQILRELSSALVVRAVHSRSQLEEILVDFWFNHFNVYAADGPTRYAIIGYFRDAIRPHVLGRFEDLVLATAESPAMLYYLDNYLNVRPGSRGRNSGINENYARELLELHTVGVDGGYDQDDVIEVAEAFTGWTIQLPTDDREPFVYAPNLHVNGDKEVMGYPITSEGIEQGREIIRFLAGLPATADFVVGKLVARLVADDPPAALVERASARFLATGGDLRAVVELILKSDEFYDEQYRQAKVKSPFELVASSLRALDANVVYGLRAAQVIGVLGQPNLLAEPPTGYKEDAAAVTSVGGMLTRFDMAYEFAANRIPGVEIDTGRWERLDAGGFGADRVLLDLLHDQAGADTRRALRLAERQGADSLLLGAMALGCPEFQLQ